MRVCWPFLIKWFTAAHLVQLDYGWCQHVFFGPVVFLTAVGGMLALSCFLKPSVLLGCFQFLIGHFLFFFHCLFWPSLWCKSSLYLEFWPLWCTLLSSINEIFFADQKKKKRSFITAEMELSEEYEQVSIWLVQFLFSQNSSYLRSSRLKLVWDRFDEVKHIYKAGYWS